MRVLLWHWGRRGGGPQRLLTLAEALAWQPDTQVALSISRQSDLARETVALGLPTELVDTYTTRLGFVLGTARLPWARARLLHQARAFGADVVVSVMTHLWTPLVAPAVSRAVPFVPMVHDARPHPGDPGALWGWRLRRELAAGRAAIALSDAVAHDLARLWPGLPTYRLPLGTDLPAASLIAAAPRTGAGCRFLLFGRLRAYKGLDLLRDAFPLVLAQHPDATLRIVGDGDAERLAPGLAALPGVRVEARWVDEGEIPALLAGADALVLPYREASQSGIVSLAFALGVPVVATPVGALAEQVTDRADGLVATAVTPAALAAAMANMCDPAVRARLAAGAARTGRALADWDAQAAALVAILRDILSGGG